MIHVCFALYDPAGHYSKFTGTAMLSLFENTKAKITVHFLHDNTLTDYNRAKFLELTKRYGQILKFYNVEELCTDRVKQITEYFPDVGKDRHSIAMFYRFFMPYLLLPQGIEKAIYLDSDIIVNLDITELWQIELGDKPFGAIPEFYQIKDREDAIRTKNKSIVICGDGVVNVENYFNSGVMLINLEVLDAEEDTLLAGMKFISEHTQYKFLDQDILNYAFSTTYLKLPLKYNRFVLYARRENDWDIEDKIYHYAASRMCFVMDSRDSYNQLFMSYFIRTPWIDADTRAALLGGLPTQKKCPVSVIIPLYNMEEYVGETLDSLLAQTFKAFEVIVVDDCSTDNSCAVVESYVPKFNGRLKLIRQKENSGTGGYVPRNVGLKLARGEYVYILDSDDMILSHALESFYKAATLYNAEAVYTKTCFFLTAPDEIARYRDFITRKSPEINTEFTVDDTDDNVSRLLSSDARGEFNTIQTLFVQRKFLIDNKLLFPQITRTGDFLWVIGIYCHVKRFLRTSTPLCIRRRYNDNSITRTVREPQEQCLFWLARLVEFSESLYKMKSTNEILAENPVYDLPILKKNLLWSLDRTEDARKELGTEELFNVLRSDFAKNYSDSSASLLAFFFSFIDETVKTNAYYSKIFDKFNRHFMARIDIKFISPEGDLQIVSVSDDRAGIESPPWLNRDGIGYTIRSYAGSLEVVLKASASGKIHFDLRGRDIRDSKNRNKRIPYWIDYTNLTINDKVIFGKLRAVWHDKPYRCDIDVEADEEVKINVEWQPHRDDRIDLSARYAQIQDSNFVPFMIDKVTDYFSEITAKIQESNSALLVIDKFKDYLTARVDIILTEGDSDDLQITVSDKKAVVKKPGWLQKNGVCYQIESYAGNMKIIAKAFADGQLNLSLKGIWVPDPEDKSKRLRYWIDFTKCIVNEEVILDKITPVWNGKPYVYNTEIKAEEEIEINVEWQPHRGKA